MSNLPKLFRYEDKPIRVVMIDNDPWWVAKDVCEVFGETNRNRAMQALDGDEKGYTQMITPGGVQQLAIVNEPGLYSLLFAMQPSKARGVSDEYIFEREQKLKEFKRWVTHEVLPSIRRYGLYATDNVIDKILADPDFGIQLLTNYKEERQRRIEAERTNAILMHVTKTYTSTEIAKELGFKSAQELNKDLAKRRIHFKQNNTWVLYSDFANRGYVDIKQEVLDNGKVIYHRRWTQLGREFLLTLYNESVQAM